MIFGDVISRVHKVWKIISKKKASTNYFVQKTNLKKKIAYKH